MQRLDRRAWYECTSDLTKGFTYSQMPAVTWSALQPYQHRWRADANQPRANIQQNSGRAVIVTGDNARYSDDNALLQLRRSAGSPMPGCRRTRPHHTAVRAHLHGRQRVRLLSTRSSIGGRG